MSDLDRKALWDWNGEPIPEKEQEWDRPFTDEELQWYRLWFEFLQQSDKEKWSDKVEDYFGDVFSMNFEAWWPKHAYLFRKLKYLTITEIDDDADYEIYRDDGSDLEKDMVIVAIHFHQPRAVLRAKFDELLNKYHKGDVGRPKFDDWGDVFPLHQRPDTELLKKILAVHKIYKVEQSKPEDQRKVLWEIEEEVSKTLPLIDKTSKMAGYIWKEKDVDAMLLEKRRNTQHTTVKKYLNYAEQILENIVAGNFPVYEISTVKKGDKK